MYTCRWLPKVTQQRIQGPSSQTALPQIMRSDGCRELKNPRARIPINEPKGAVWLRKYKEATATGNVLDGYQNSRRAAPSKGREAQKYFKLPIETGEPLQWYGASAVLGHVWMARVDGLALCYSRTESDYNGLVKKYHAAMAERNEACKCRSCR